MGLKHNKTHACDLNKYGISGDYLGVAFVTNRYRVSQAFCSDTVHIIITVIEKVRIMKLIFWL